MLSEIKKISLSCHADTRSLYFGPYVDKRVAAFHISKKRKNLFLTVTDITGSVVSTVSTKFFAPDRKKRFAPHIVELVVRQLVLVLKAYRIVSVRLFVRISKSYLVKATMRTLKACGIPISFAEDSLAVAHNGCRKKKRRRL